MNLEDRLNHSYLEVVFLKNVSFEDFSSFVSKFKHPLIEILLHYNKKANFVKIRFISKRANRSHASLYRIMTLTILEDELGVQVKTHREDDDAFASKYREEINGL